MHVALFALGGLEAQEGGDLVPGALEYDTVASAALEDFALEPVSHPEQLPLDWREESGDAGGRLVLFIHAVGLLGGGVSQGGEGADREAGGVQRGKEAQIERRKVSSAARRRK